MVQSTQYSPLHFFRFFSVVNGSVEFSYELGSGPVTILLSEQKVNDNQKHTVTARRQKLDGSIQLDGTFSKSGSSKGGLTQLNTSGNVFIGKRLTPNCEREMTI